MRGKGDAVSSPTNLESPSAPGAATPSPHVTTGTNDDKVTSEGGAAGRPTVASPSEESAKPAKGSASPAETAAKPKESAPQPQAEEKPPLFDNSVEEQLELVSRDGFESIVSLRVDLSKEQILEILRRPVDIYEDDDADTVAAKERTAEMKAEALKFIEAGGTLNQFLRDCQAEANEAREAVKDVSEEMKRILFEQGEEAAQAYLDEQNPRLKAQGLREVHIGKGLLMTLEKRRAREAAK